MQAIFTASSPAPATSELREQSPTRVLVDEGRPEALDELGARVFAESAMTAPVIVRAYDAAPVAASPVLSIDDAAVIGRLRRAEKGEGLVLTLVNPTAEARRVSVGLRDADIAGAERISAVEELLGIAGEISDGNLSCQVPPGATQVYRLALG